MFSSTPPFLNQKAWFIGIASQGGCMFGKHQYDFNGTQRIQLGFHLRLPRGWPWVAMVSENCINSEHPEILEITNQQADVV